VEQDLSDIIGNIVAHRLAQAGENLVYKDNQTLHDVVIGGEKEMLQSMSVSPVPEPNIYLMMLVGVASLGFFTYKRRTILLTENPMPA
jgi:hypothetical protein